MIGYRLPMTVKPSVSKKARRRRFCFWVLTWHPKTRFPYTINSVTDFSNKNTVSPISGGFTFDVLGLPRYYILCNCAYAIIRPQVRRGAKKLSVFISKLSAKPRDLGHNFHPGIVATDGFQDSRLSLFQPTFTPKSNVLLAASLVEHNSHLCTVIM